MIAPFSRRLFLSMSAACGMVGPCLANGLPPIGAGHVAETAPPLACRFGALYAVMPDRPPVHLLDFERLPPHRPGEATMVGFRAPVTGARLAAFTNPLTGLTHAVPHRLAIAACGDGMAKAAADPAAASAEIMFAASAITPFMPWLGMGALPGFALWYGSGPAIVGAAA